MKPGNLIITPAGEVKLIDFGVARVRQQENEGKWRAELAVNESGTPAYSSMQVLTGEDPAPADDVFSLACLFYRLVAGYRVYGPRNAAQAAEDGMEPQRPQALSAAQWQPLKNALSYSRVTRFESPKAFINALCGKSRAVLPAGGKNPQRNEPVTEVPDIRSAQPVVVPPPATISIPNQAAQPALAPAAAPLEIPAAIARVEEPVVAKPPASSDFVAPMRAESDSKMYELNEDDMGRSYFGITMFILFAIGIGFIATQTDWVDRIGQAIETGDVFPIAEI